MQPVDLNDLSSWFRSEVLSVTIESHRRALLEVGLNLDSYLCWPQRAELLWDGCNRIRGKQQRQKYHAYPAELRASLSSQVRLDCRSNGPAITAFLQAGGERPVRSNGQGWGIHHLYDGKFPWPGRASTSLQAVKSPRHFTQSAGLVSIHPIAHALADEFASFAWRLRAESFIRFAYDPDNVFIAHTNEYGFADLQSSKIWHCSLAAFSQAT